MEMRNILAIIGTGLSIAALQSTAHAAAQDDMKTAGCPACHEVDKKKVGPSFKDISAKYKGKKADEVAAGMKSKPVHKGVLGKTNDAALHGMVEWIQTQ
jgi:cytochrome c551/c552